MDTKANLDQLVVTANLSVKKLDKNVAVMETDNVVDLPSTPLSPITPDSNKENSDLVSSFMSPMSLASLPASMGVYMNEDSDDTPGTPKDSVFDPFAPGPDKMVLAPVSMKYFEESRNYVARRLNFNSVMTKKDCEKRAGVVERCIEDDLLLEAVYDSLLEVIICKQAEDMVAEMSVFVDSSPDAVKTPPFATRLTGIADACPGAPLKAGKKSRKIDLGLCRKLEFDL
uniref:unknown protein 1 n=1 Tax=Erigeron canadensis TaxID=72917 RepID=UPI001CB93184|nr:unknown protein 1 [Erigeron canadensis]